jgi:hypothetical protein
MADNDINFNLDEFIDEDLELLNFSDNNFDSLTSSDSDN